MKHRLKLCHALLAATATSVVTIMAGCTPSAVPAPPAPNPAAPPPASRQSTPAAPMSTTTSSATNPRDYRRDAANHLYRQNAHRIFQGKLPAMLYAIGVLQVEIDGNGRVTGTHWLRAPKHAPEVVAEIERTVRLAAPFPAPARMGRVTYTDTWLWDKSGRFQLDTLTEGQL
jgi:periplasmic protein TonB